MPYQVIFKPSAQKELARLAWRDREKILERLEVLVTDATPPAAVKLKGYDGLWRIRSGNFRAVYTEPDGNDVIRIVRVGHRRVVYKIH